jgi:hypothetical protein
MDEALVRQRAEDRCEYGHLPRECSSTPFEIDHIIAEQHGGETVASNLALACFGCCLSPHLRDHRQIISVTAANDRISVDGAVAVAADQCSL